MVCVIEKRNTPRTDVSWPVSVWHPKALRFYNGLSTNVSNTGALVTLPMHIPVREGQDLELNFPRMEDLAQKKGAFARIKKGKVIRVDRRDMLRSAQVKVALVFAE